MFKIMRSIAISALASAVLLSIATPANAETLNHKPISKITQKASVVKKSSDGWFLYPAKIEANQAAEPVCYMAAMVNVWNASHPTKQISQKEFWRLQTESQAREGRRVGRDKYDTPSWNELDESGYKIQNWTNYDTWQSAVSAATNGPLYLSLVMDQAGIEADPQSPGRGVVPRWTPSKTNIQNEVRTGTFMRYASERYAHAVYISGVNPSKKLVRITNNWGQYWGYGGDVVVTYPDFANAFVSATAFTW